MKELLSLSKNDEGKKKKKKENLKYAHSLIGICNSAFFFPLNEMIDQVFLKEINYDLKSVRQAMLEFELFTKTLNII